MNRGFMNKSFDELLKEAQESLKLMCMDRSELCAEVVRLQRIVKEYENKEKQRELLLTPCSCSGSISALGHTFEQCKRCKELREL